MKFYVVWGGRTKAETLCIKSELRVGDFCYIETLEGDFDVRIVERVYHERFEQWTFVGERERRTNEII